MTSITNVPMFAGTKLFSATPAAYAASTGMYVTPPGYAYRRIPYQPSAVSTVCAPWKRQPRTMYPIEMSLSVSHSCFSQPQTSIPARRRATRRTRIPTSHAAIRKTRRRAGTDSGATPLGAAIASDMRGA